MHRSLEVGRSVRRVLSVRAGVAVVAIVAVAGACVAVAAGSSQARPGTPAAAVARPRGASLSPFGLGNDEGATVSGMTEYQAQNAATNGTVIGPGYVQGTLANEASGRAAVQLRAAGQYVQFRLTAPANALDISYALPPGTSALLAIYLNGARLAGGLPLTSRNQDIPAPVPHHFFDDARLLLGRQLAAGATVRLQAGPGAAAAPATIDVADFYQVPAPARQPRGSVSVLAEGADPSGRADSAAAFRKAIAVAAARRAPVWIPAGSYRVSAPLHVAAATITGAGDWYAQIIAGQFIANPAAVPGPVRLSGFAILGPGAAGSGAAISGSLGTGSTLSGLWIQDTSAGLWLRARTTRLTVQDCEILATSGDGISLAGHTAGAWLRGNFLRHTGGDAVALWSGTASTVSDNTIVAPDLGNGIAVYGGTGAGIIDNVIADTGAAGSGITIASQDSGQNGSAPLAGTITVGDNTVLRSGAVSPAPAGPLGAIRIDAYDDPITHVTLNIIDNTIDDSPCSALVITSGRGAGLPVTGVRFDGDTINGTGTVAVQAQTSGSATFTGVTATGIGVPGIYNSPRPPGHASFTFHLGPGNTGWTTTPVLTSFPRPTGPAAPGTATTSPGPGASIPTGRNRVPSGRRTPGRTPGPVTATPAPRRSAPGSSPPSASPSTPPVGPPSPGPSKRPGLTLTASASLVSRGANVTFSYSTPPGTRSSSNWIAVYDVGLATTSNLHTAYVFTPGASGSVTLSTRSFIGSGSYEVYYFYKDSFQVLAGPVSLIVTGAHPTLTLSAASVHIGSNVTIKYTAPAGMRTSGNWIGLFPYNRWIPNVNNTIVSGEAPGASGSVTLSTSSVPSPGVYYVFFLYDGGWLWLDGPISVSVTGT